MGESRGWTIVRAVMSLTYPGSNAKSGRQFGAAITRGDYDIVHRITPLSPRPRARSAAEMPQGGVPHLAPEPASVAQGFEAEQKQEGEWLRASEC